MALSLHSLPRVMLKGHAHELLVIHALLLTCAPLPQAMDWGLPGSSRQQQHRPHLLTCDTPHSLSHAHQLFMCVPVMHQLLEGIAWAHIPQAPTQTSTLQASYHQRSSRDHERLRQGDTQLHGSGGSSAAVCACSG